MPQRRENGRGGQQRNVVCLTNLAELVELCILITSTRKRKIKTRARKAQIGPIINSLVH